MLLVVVVSCCVLRPGRSAIVRRDSRSGGAHARLDRTQRFGTQRFGVRGVAFGARARRFCRGGGGSSSRVLIALLLVALVAAVLAASRSAAVAQTSPIPAGSEEVWSATVTVRDLVPGSVTGCDDQDSVRRFRCNSFNNLTDRTFRVGSTTYRVKSVQVGFNQLELGIDPLAPTRLAGWSLVVTGHVETTNSFGDSYVVPRTYTAEITTQGIILFAGVPDWQPGLSIELALYRPHGDQVPEDLRKSASRGGRCGAPEDGLSPDSDEAGYWHCHGDSVYHRHAGTWRGSHQPGGDPPQPPGLRPEPRPPTQEERDRGFADNWNGGWHWHGDDIYHIHRSPH